ncbi:MAG: hypothetical protein V4451_04775 [Pseudomonadota bacterium]
MSAETFPFRLCDVHQSHLKFNGREPRTLTELAYARAEYTHRCRLAEIKLLSKKLELLDALLPDLAKQGVSLNWREMVGGERCKVIRIQSAMFMEHNSALLKALQAVGFRELDRKPWGAYETVKFKHGRALIVELDVKRPEPEKAAPVSEAVPS